MSSAHNTIFVIGNLTADPDLRYTQSGVAVMQARVAVNRRVKNSQTDEWEDALDGFFNVEIWRDYAENAAESLSKGDQVFVVGRLATRSYEVDGETKWVTEIKADEIGPTLRWARAELGRTSRSSGGNGRSAPHPADRATPPEPPTPDDVPF